MSRDSVSVHRGLAIRWAPGVAPADRRQRPLRDRVPPVHRAVVLLALAACEPTADAPDRGNLPPVTWVYPPPPGAFPLGASQGWLGRSQPPQPITALGIASAAGPDAGLAPLRLATA